MTIHRPSLESIEDGLVAAGFEARASAYSIWVGEIQVEVQSQKRDFGYGASIGVALVASFNDWRHKKVHRRVKFVCRTSNNVERKVLHDDPIAPEALTRFIPKLREVIALKAEDDKTRAANNAARVQDEKITRSREAALSGTEFKLHHDGSVKFWPRAWDREAFIAASRILFP